MREIFRVNGSMNIASTWRCGSETSRVIQLKNALLKSEILLTQLDMLMHFVLSLATCFLREIINVNIFTVDESPPQFPRKATELKIF